MYREFFGLRHAPFNNTPDPRFFYETPDHEEALASLMYASEERKGFVLVTGEVGSGKTLLSRLLLTRLSPGARTAVITNTRLSGPELLAAICREFDLDVEPDASKAELCRALEGFLLEQYARDRLAVVVLDEAQNLPLEAFEELRMLGNLEADDAKLLQVLVLGQPELQSAFRLPSMRQLYQRLFRTFHLKGLDLALTCGYIAHRLHVAGLSQEERIFDAAAAEEIHRQSEGVPRLINQICDNAMLAAYTEGSRCIGRGLIDEVIEQMMSLTASIGAPRPRGALARHFLDGPQDAGGESATADDPADAVRLKQLEQQHRALQARLDDVLSHVGSADGKVATAAATYKHDRLLGEVEARMQALNAENEQLRSGFAELQREARARADAQSAEIAHARQQREQAAELLEQTVADTRKITEQTNRVLEQARATCDQIERHAAEAHGQAESVKSDLRRHAEFLMVDVQRHLEEEKVRIAAQLREEQDKFQAARREVEGVSEDMRKDVGTLRERAEEMQRFAQQQIEGLGGELRALHERTDARAGELVGALESLLNESRSRLESSQKQFADDLAAAHKDVMASRDAVRTTRGEVMTEVEACRTEAQQSLEQTHDLLVKTREQAASLLAGLRRQATEQKEAAEKTWNQAIADGARTLIDLQSKLAETRTLTDRSKGELEALIRQANEALENTRTAFHDGLGAHRTDVERLTQDAAAIKVDIINQFRSAQADLDEAHRQHMERLRGQFDESQDSVAAIEARANKTIDFLRHELDNASVSANRICAELESSIERFQANVEKYQSDYDNESDRVQQTLADLVEHNHALVAEAREQIQQIATRAAETTEALTERIESLQAKGEEGVAHAGKELERTIADAIQRSEQLRVASENASQGFERRITEARKRANDAITLAEQSINRVRQHSRSALEDVRASFTQMVERSDNIQRDLSRTGSEIQAETKKTADQFKRTASDVISQIEALVENSEKNVKNNERRLLTIKEQVEHSAEQIRENAARLLDEAQAGAGSLMQHAADLLSQAREGSDKIGLQAETLIAHAQSAADRFRSEAEQLMRSAEQTAQSVESQVHALRSDVTAFKEEVASDADAVRGEIRDAREDLVEVREQSVEAANEAARIHQAARSRSEELIRSAEEVRQQSEALLAMPRELVDEANRRAAALSDMSKKISGVVKHLSTAGDDAERNRKLLADAGREADEKVAALKKHTERVGQLVGIIRQLYGTMDARIDRLRDRLGQVDQMYRGVPQEIEALRDALTGDDKSPRPPAKQQAAADKTKSPVTVRRAPADAAGKNDTLAHAMRNNQKLNAWLKEILEQPHDAPPREPTRKSDRATDAPTSAAAT